MSDSLEAFMYQATTCVAQNIQAQYTHAQVYYSRLIKAYERKRCD